MGSVAIFLVAIAGILVLGAVGEIVFRKTQLPDVLWLIAAGIFLGPVTGILTREQLGHVAPYFAAITLVVVLFEGGSRLKLSDVSRAAPRSGILAVFTFLLAVVVVAALSMLAKWAGWLPEVWSPQHGILLGAILGGSSSIIIMPSMSLAKVESKIANLVNLESAFTDAFCVVGASAMIDVLASQGTHGQSPLVALGRSFGIGLGIGTVGATAWLLMLRVLRGSEHAYPATLSALLALYVVIDHAGGSAALGILAFAVLVGNADIIGKKLDIPGLELGSEVRGVHSQIAFIIKSFFFTFIGAMLGPPWSLFALGVGLGAVLFAARVPGVRLAVLGARLDRNERRLVDVSMPRGMAAGVLATLPAAAGIAGTERLATIVFATVLTSIVVFAIGFRSARKALPVPVPPMPLTETPVGALAADVPPAESATPPPVATEPGGDEPAQG